MTESVSELVADGEVELAIIVIPNIMSVPGVELVGLAAAAELNSYVTFTAGIFGRSRRTNRRRANSSNCSRAPPLPT